MLEIELGKKIELVMDLPDATKTTHIMVSKHDIELPVVGGLTTALFVGDQIISWHVMNLVLTENLVGIYFKEAVYFTRPFSPQLPLA